MAGCSTALVHEHIPWEKEGRIEKYGREAEKRVYWNRIKNKYTKKNK